MKANLLCEALRAARLFEPDRNEEKKGTNEHVYREQRMSIFFSLINKPITLTHSGLNECILYRLPGRIPGFLFFHCSCFPEFFFFD